MLRVTLPKLCKSEQLYVTDLLLNEFLGLEYTAEFAAVDYMEIEFTRCKHQKKLTIDSTFFQLAQSHWCQIDSLPKQPLLHWDCQEEEFSSHLVKNELPVIYGQPGIVKSEQQWHLNLDVFGSSFFMLSRYEEVVIEERDNHGRFSAKSSLAFKQKFLDRPIVNEYVEILWHCISHLWPELVRTQKVFRNVISCDVDHPFDHASLSLKKTILRIGARVIRDKNPKLALLDGLNYLFKKIGYYTFDSYRNNVEWLIEKNKQAGNQVAFYFIPIQTHKTREDANDVRSDYISNLLKHIVNNGHEVGFHPGYDTYNNGDNFNESAEALKQAMADQNLKFCGIGGRQHYLMYDISQTPKLWEKNGFAYDSSLGFSDRAGFRCGTCYEYSMYDLSNRSRLNLKQRPLVVMDSTVVDDSYEGLGFSSEAKHRILYFKEICQKYNGDFTLLWHNSYFHNTKAKKFYEALIK